MSNVTCWGGSSTWLFALARLALNHLSVLATSPFDKTIEPSRLANLVTPSFDWSVPVSHRASPVQPQKRLLLPVLQAQHNCYFLISE